MNPDSQVKYAALDSAVSAGVDTLKVSRSGLLHLCVLFFGTLVTVALGRLSWRNELLRMTLPLTPASLLGRSSAGARLGRIHAFMQRAEHIASAHCHTTRERLDQFITGHQCWPNRLAFVNL